MGTKRQQDLPSELTVLFSATGGCERLTGVRVRLRNLVASADHAIRARIAEPVEEYFPAGSVDRRSPEPTFAGQVEWEGCPGALALQVEWWPGDRPDQADSRLFVSHCAGPEGLGAILPCRASFREDGHQTMVYAAVVCSKAFGCPHCSEGGTVTVTVEESGDAETRRRGANSLVLSPEKAIPAGIASSVEGIPSSNAATAPGRPLSASPRLRVSASPPRIRAGIITPSLWLGGVERWIDQIIRATEAAIDWAGVAVLTEELVQPDALALLRRRVPVHGFDYAAARPLFERTDVLLAWGAQNLPHVLDGYRGKVVLVSHSDYQGYMRHVVRSSARVCTHFVAVSDYAKGPFYGCVPEDRIDVIANGVDIGRCTSRMSRQEARAAYGFGDDDFVLGTIGRLSEEKRIERQILALDDLPPEFRLLIVGDGFPEYTAALHALAAQRPTRARRVTFVPSTREIGPILAGLDAFVQTSESEGFCLADLEALAAGVPLVATPVGILPQLESSGRACWEPLPPDPTPRAVAEAIMQLDRQPIWVIVNRREVGRRLVREHYSLEAFGTRWTQYLERIAQA